jgi:hypothetical protein
MTTHIIAVIYFLLRFFSARVSCLIASFVGESVIGHGIMEGNIACYNVVVC